jgi:hypothetical protein
MVAETIGRSEEDVRVGAGETAVGAQEYMQGLIKVGGEHQER